MKNNFEIIVFGGGCFWCTEAVFKDIKGVVSVLPGYAGGNTLNPDYYQVCSGKTGHAEVVQIEFNPTIITLEELLKIFFATHDPTSLNKQGNDVGTQYRSLILYSDIKQLEIINKFIKNLPVNSEVVTEIEPLDKFYEAEPEHHDYFSKNPNQAYCQIIINPKLQKLRNEYKNYLK